MSDSASDAIDDYLQEQFAEGQRDSEGVFTIDVNQAHRKLAAFQMRTPESWLLVLVQAAHRGKARGLTVSHLPRQTTVVTSGGQNWSWDDLAGVLNGGTTTAPDLFSMAVAVRTLSAHAGLRGFRLKTPDEAIAEWDGREMTVRPARLEEKLRGGEVVVEVFHRAVYGKSSWFFEARGSASAALSALTRALESFAFASAVPITCDGRRLSGIHLGEPSEDGLACRPVALLPLNSEGVPPSDFGSALDWTGSALGGVELDRGWTEVRPFAAVLLLHVTWSKTRRSFGLTQGLSRLVWVQDGVVVREQNLPLEGRLGLTVVVSGAGLTTDLSGLHLVESQALHERSAHIASDLPRAVADLWEQSQRGAAGEETGAWQAGRARFMASTFEGGVAFPRGLGLNAPASSILSALGLGRSSTNHWDDTLDQEFETLAQRVTEALQSAPGEAAS